MTGAPDAPEVRRSDAPDARLSSALRGRLVAAALAVVLPGSCSQLLARQARKLDALADHGAVGEATVTAASGGGTSYAYQVPNSTETYTWNVARAVAPLAVGERLPIVYLPEEPSFSRPVSPRSTPAHEARKNRSFATKLVVGLFLLLAGLAALFQREISRLRRGIVLDPRDPVVYRARLRSTFALMTCVVAAITGFHASDALARGEPLIPIGLGGLLLVGLLGGLFLYFGRDGPLKAPANAARLLRWVAPVGIAIGVLRVILLLLQK